MIFKKKMLSIELQQILTGYCKKQQDPIGWTIQPRAKL